MNKSFLYFIFFLILPNIAYAANEGPIIILKYLLFFFLLIFNSYIFAIIFVILGIIVLFWNFILGLDDKISTKKILTAGFFGLGLILVGIMIVYSVDNFEYLSKGFDKKIFDWIIKDLL